MTHDDERPLALGQPEQALRAVPRLLLIRGSTVDPRLELIRPGDGVTGEQDGPALWKAHR